MSLIIAFLYSCILCFCMLILFMPNYMNVYVLYMCFEQFIRVYIKAAASAADLSEMRVLDDVDNCAFSHLEACGCDFQ